MPIGDYKLPDLGGEAGQVLVAGTFQTVDEQRHLSWKDALEVGGPDLFDANKNVPNDPKIHIAVLQSWRDSIGGVPLTPLQLRMLGVYYSINPPAKGIAISIAAVIRTNEWLYERLEWTAEDLLAYALEEGPQL